jgi:transposase-like protein
MKTKQVCPNCKSESVKKRGFRQTENRGKIQRYECKSCKTAFVQNDGFYRMRNSPQKITLCMDLFYRGVSTRKVQEHLQAFYPQNSSWVSIYSWILKYAKQMGNFTDKLKIKVGSEIQIDEVEYHRRKSHKAKKGIDTNFFVDGVDTETRFMVASEYVKSRSREKIKSVLEQIRDRSINKPQAITTDGLMVYPKAVRKVFGYSRHAKQYAVRHNVVTARKGEGFNHPIERLHNSLRARTKTFRGFHGSIESANAIMKGLAVYYNFITRHQAINCSPYELATDLKLNSENKWLELIQLAI